MHGIIGIDTHDFTREMTSSRTMRHSIELGDRFKKVGIAEKTWVAVRFVDIPDLPQHVYLMNEADDLDMQTLSSVALGDRRLYEKIRLAS